MVRYRCDVFCIVIYRISYFSHLVFAKHLCRCDPRHQTVSTEHHLVDSKVSCTQNFKFVCAKFKEFYVARYESI